MAARETTNSRWLHMVLLFVLSIVSFGCNLNAILSNSWKKASARTGYRASSHHGLWELCEVTDDPKKKDSMKEMCVSIKTSEFSKIVLVFCVVGQLAIALALSFTLVGMIRYGRRLQCCKKFSFAISMLTTIFCCNTLIIFSQMMAIIVFLGEGRNMLFEGAFYPFSATLDSSGTISCVISIFVAMLIDIWLGFVINFENLAKIKCSDDIRRKSDALALRMDALIGH